MGGDDSQKVRPWRGIALLSGAPQTSGSPQHHTVTENCSGISQSDAPFPASRLVTQLPTAWVIFGKQRRVSSGARRRRENQAAQRYGRVRAETGREGIRYKVHSHSTGASSRLSTGCDYEWNTWRLDRCDVRARLDHQGLRHFVLRSILGWHRRPSRRCPAAV